MWKARDLVLRSLHSGMKGRPLSAPFQHGAIHVWQGTQVRIAHFGQRGEIDEVFRKSVDQGFSKAEMHKNHLWIWLKHKFWTNRHGVGPEILHVLQAASWCCCLLLTALTLSSTGCDRIVCVVSSGEWHEFKSKSFIYFLWQDLTRLIFLLRETTPSPSNQNDKTTFLFPVQWFSKETYLNDERSLKTRAHPLAPSFPNNHHYSKPF